MKNILLVTIILLLVSVTFSYTLVTYANNANTPRSGEVQEFAQRASK